MYTDIKYKFIRHVEALMIYIFLWTTSVCFAEEVILTFEMSEFISWYFKRLSERHHTYFFHCFESFDIKSFLTVVIAVFRLLHFFFHFLHFGKLLFSRLKSFLLECVLKHWKLFDCERDGREFGNIYYLNEQRIREKENDRK